MRVVFQDQQQQQLSSDAQRVRRSSRISSASLHSRNEGSEAGEDLASLPHAEVVLDDASDSGEYYTELNRQYADVSLMLPR